MISKSRDSTLVLDFAWERSTSFPQSLFLHWRVRCSRICSSYRKCHQREKGTIAFHNPDKSKLYQLRDYIAYSALVKTSQELPHR